MQSNERRIRAYRLEPVVDMCKDLGTRFLGRTVLFIFAGPVLLVFKFLSHLIQQFGQTVTGGSRYHPTMRIVHSARLRTGVGAHTIMRLLSFKDANFQQRMYVPNKKGRE